MRIGMMWQFDSKSFVLESEIQAAAAHYLKKYAQAPTLVHVHPSRVNGTTRVGEINILPNRSVLPNLLWLGIEEEEPVK